MFSWFWEFLYMISKTIFRLIDGLILCANKLCGIEPIYLDGEPTDFLTYLIFSDSISFAFKASAILATILLVVFTVFMIIRTISKDKVEGTPGQIAVKSFKTLLMFFFIPAVMIAFMTIGNAFVKALYAATSQAAATPGTFLFCSFAADGGMSPELVNRLSTGELDYYSTTTVSYSMILSDFPFLFSWLAGGVVLFSIGSAMLVFVDRVLSIVILYIAAPISISTSVLDDGARFKLWRDQFLAKFIMGYGMIIAINIYALVCGLVMSPDIKFFAGESTTDEFLNLLMKLLIIAGGALTLQKSMALIGNLVSSGAGSNELRDTMSAGSIAKMAGGAAKSALGLAGGALSLPFVPAKDMVKDMYSQFIRKHAASAMGYDKDEKSKDSKGSSGAKNDNKANYGSDPNAAKNAIQDEGFKTANWDSKDKDSGNGNPNQPKTQNNNALTNAIQNTGGNNNNNKQKNQPNNKNTQKQQQQGKGENKK